MTDDVEALRLAMEAAAAAGDFERAAILRDRLSLARAGADDAAAIDVSGLTRQRAGAMGIGSNRAQPATPAGWRKPAKPDPLVSNTGRPKRPR